MLTEITLVSDERTCIPTPLLCPIHLQIKLLRIVFPIAHQLMNDHTNFVQEVPRDLPCLPKMLAIYVVENVSKHLDNPIYDVLRLFWSILQIFLSIGRYCIRCLTVTTWQSCNNVQQRVVTNARLLITGDWTTTTKTKTMLQSWQLCCWSVFGHQRKRDEPRWTKHDINSPMRDREITLHPARVSPSTMRVPPSV